MKEFKNNNKKPGGMRAENKYSKRNRDTHKKEKRKRERQIKNLISAC